jgi:hypothetical protein
MDADVDTTLRPHRKDLTVVEVDISDCMGKGMNMISPEAPVLPDKTLYNIGVDIALTDIVCIAPAGLLFDPEDGPIFERQLLHSGSRWGAEGSALPVAIVVPVFTPWGTMTGRERAFENAFQDALASASAAALAADAGVDSGDKEGFRQRRHRNSGGHRRNLQGAANVKRDNVEAEIDPYIEETTEELVKKDSTENRVPAAKPVGVRKKRSPTDMIAYPPRGSLCGVNQPERLRIPYHRAPLHGRGRDADGLEAIDFNAAVSKFIYIYQSLFATHHTIAYAVV